MHGEKLFHNTECFFKNILISMRDYGCYYLLFISTNIKSGRKMDMGHFIENEVDTSNWPTTRIKKNWPSLGMREIQ